jgi:hypothetical protein
MKDYDLNIIRRTLPELEAFFWRAHDPAKAEEHSRTMRGYQEFLSVSLGNSEEGEKVEMQEYYMRLIPLLRNSIYQIGKEAMPGKASEYANDP